MNPLALYIARALEGGATLQEAKDRWTAAYGAPTAVEWARDVQTAQSQRRARAALDNPGDQRTIRTVTRGERLGRGENVRVRASVRATDSSGSKFTLPVDVVVSLDQTVADLHEQIANFMEGLYGDVQVDDVSLEVDIQRY